MNRPSDLEDFKKTINNLVKSYNYPVFLWKAFFKQDIHGYEGKAYEVVQRMAQRKPSPLKIAYFFALLGEMEDISKPVGLKPYIEKGLYALLSKTGKRMKKYENAPLYECLGIEKKIAEKYVVNAQNAFIKHPLNAAKAYAAMINKAESWQEVLFKTYSFSMVVNELNKRVSESKIKNRLMNMGRGIGVVRV